MRLYHCFRGGFNFYEEQYSTRHTIVELILLFGQHHFNKFYSYIFCAILVGLGNISVLSFIVILKCHDNRYQKYFFSIVISSAQYYR